MSRDLYKQDSISLEKKILNSFILLLLTLGVGFGCFYGYNYFGTDDIETPSQDKVSKSLGYSISDDRNEKKSYSCVKLRKGEAFAGAVKRLNEINNTRYGWKPIMDSQELTYESVTRLQPGFEICPLDHVENDDFSNTDNVRCISLRNGESFASAVYRLNEIHDTNYRWKVVMESLGYKIENLKRLRVGDKICLPS